MKIRTWFYLAMTLFGVMLLVTVVLLWTATRQIAAVREQEEIASNIERAARELSYISNDFLLHREEQQRARWQAKAAEISAELSRLNIDSPEQAALVESINANQERLRAIFNSVVSAIAIEPQTPDAGAELDLIKQSWSRMEVQNQGTVFDTLLLSESFHQQELQSMQTRNNLIFALVGVFIAFLFVNYYFTYRRVLKAFSTLQSWAWIIGSGELDTAIPVEREDEIGELSRSFNVMASNLKNVMASKSDLEHEMAERREAEEGLKNSEESLKRAQEIAHLGSWELDIITGKLTWSDEVYRIFGLEPPEFGATYEAFLEYVHPDDRASVDAAYTGSVKAGKDGYEIEHRVVQKSAGDIRFVHERCRHVRDESGKIIKSLGMVHDITDHKRAEEALKQSEEKYRTLFENMTEGFGLHEIILDADGKPCDYRFLELNDSFARLTGLSTKELVGRTVNEALPGIEPYWIETYGNVALTGKPVHFENYSAHLKRWYDTYAYATGKNRFAVVFMDITARRQAEEELRASEKRYRSFIEVTGELGWVTNPGGEVVEDIPSFRQFTGQSYEEVRGGGWSKALHPDDLENTSRVWQKAVREKTIYEAEYRLRRYDGVYRYFLASGVPVFSEDGDVREWVGTCIDITARKLVEEELRAHRERLEELVKERTAELRELNETLELRVLERTDELEASEQRWVTTLASIGDAVIATDTDGRITFMNYVSEELTAWTLREALGRPVMEVFNIINEDTRQTVENPVEKVLREGTIVSLANHTVLVRKDGTEVAIDDSGAPIRDEDGTLLGVVLVFRDITERKKVEAEIAHLASFPENNPNPVMELDSEGNIEYMNPASRAHFPELMRETLDSPLLDGWEEVVASIWTGKTNIVARDIAVGDMWYEQVIARTAFDPNLRVYMRDITERVRTEQLKDEFVGMVSHELKTPLTIIIGALSVASNAGASIEDTRDLLLDAVSGAQALAGIVDNLLELSRYQANRLELRSEPADVRQIAAEVIGKLKMRTEANVLTLHMPERLPLVKADRLRVERIINNLVDNAIKYAPRGEIRIFARPEESCVTIGVSDDGPGISHDDQGKLFQRFQRLQAETEGAIKGIGLGLRVCKILAEAQGGRIWVESEPGKGATFLFTLPLS